MNNATNVFVVVSIFWQDFMVFKHLSSTICVLRHKVSIISSLHGMNSKLTYQAFALLRLFNLNLKKCLGTRCYYVLWIENKKFLLNCSKNGKPFVQIIRVNSFPKLVFFPFSWLNIRVGDSALWIKSLCQIQIWTPE